MQEFIEFKSLITAIQLAFDDLDDPNIREHILQDDPNDKDHLWRKLVPDPRDPDNWEKIKKIISTVLANGIEEYYGEPEVYKKSLGVGAEIVTVTYKIINGAIRISNAWVNNNLE